MCSYDFVGWTAESKIPIDWKILQKIITGRVIYLTPIYVLLFGSIFDYVVNDIPSKRKCGLHHLTDIGENVTNLLSNNQK